MEPSTFLESDEIIALTNRVKRPSQIKVLQAMGIEHRVRPDGSVAILRAHIHKVFDGQAQDSHSKAKEPDWEAL